MGSGVGAIASTAIFTLAGWAGAARLGAAFGGTGVRFWLAFQRIDRARERSLGENVAAFQQAWRQLNTGPVGRLSTVNGRGQNEDGASERIPVLRDLAAATVNPHRLAAFARTVIGHAGGAPGRSRDLAALDHV